ncbi:MAG: hypothetical protein GX998_01845 [Firmicutes bacterium]|nr:hypothetical protein [Bacillota bacterium]
MERFTLSGSSACVKLYLTNIQRHTSSTSRTNVLANTCVSAFTISRTGVFVNTNRGEKYGNNCERAFAKGFLLCYNQVDVLRTDFREVSHREGTL